MTSPTCPLRATRTSQTASSGSGWTTSPDQIAKSRWHPAPLSLLENPGFRCGRRLVEADVPLGAERQLERVGREREKERLLRDLARMGGHRRPLALEHRAHVDGRRDP